MVPAWRPGQHDQQRAACSHARRERILLRGHLDSRSRLSTSITTRPHATSVTLRQSIAWIVAVLAVAGALLLVVSAQSRRDSHWDSAPANRSWAASRGCSGAASCSPDGGFWRPSTSTTVGSWPGIGGSVVARLLQLLQRTRRESSQWILARVVAALAGSEHHLRHPPPPARACLAATWVLCRWLYIRIVPSSARYGRLGLWAMASAFLASALAWGMTMRPEAVTGLLIAAVMVATIRFLDREGAAPLALVAVLVPLAVAGHHAGLLALAPLIVAASRIVKWARVNAAAAAAIFIAALAVGLTLAFVGSDLEQRSADAKTIGYWAPDGWFDELRRYAYLLGARR